MPVTAGGLGNEEDEEDGPSDGRARVIQDRLRHYIKHYRGKRNKNRLFTIVIRIFLILASGATTVLLGLKEGSGHESELSSVALIFSAAITAATSWDAFADHHWKWIRYRSVLHRLFAIRDNFTYLMASGAPLTQRQFDEVFEQLESVVREFDDQWTTQRTQLVNEKSKVEQPPAQSTK